MLTEQTEHPAPAGDRSPTRRGVLANECAAILRYLAVLERTEQTGPLAALRRLDRVQNGPPPEPFWAVVERAHIPVRREQFWLDLLPMMVRCPHRGGDRLGRVLRGTGAEPAVAKGHVERWLRLTAPNARVELRRLLRRVDRVDWYNLVELLDRWDDPGDERSRKHAFARDYFLHRAR